MALGAQPKLAAGGILSLMIVGLVSLFQSVGVLFGTSCLFSLVLIVVFLTSEGSPLLYAQEAENRFWTVVAMLLSSAVFFSEDSPLRIGNHSPVLGVTFVGSAASPNSPRRLRRISARRRCRSSRSGSPGTTGGSGGGGSCGRPTLAGSGAASRCGRTSTSRSRRSRASTTR